MRRNILHAAAAIMLLSLPAAVRPDIIPLQQRQMVINSDWEGEPYYRTDPMPQMIRNTLQAPREGGKDNWAWRDTVETQLVAFGPAALGALEAEAGQREGFEADAVQVAIFRLRNSPLIPNDALQQWGERRFGVSIPPGDQPVNPIKTFRVMDARDGAGLGELFPHHLFYVLECKGTRLVVALAADAKVQSLQDDAALARFIREEAAPQYSVNDKARLASAAALLMLARSVTPYQPEFRQQNLDTDLHAYKYTLQFEGFRQTATLTFTPGGMLDTLSSGQEKQEIKPAVPLSVPTATSPPPMMPE